MTTFDAHANFAYSTVATAPSPATSGTSLIVHAGDGAKFPAAPFNVTIWPAGSAPLASNAEIARCTLVATDTLTIVRAQEGSSARSIGVGDQIAATITVKTLTDIEAQTGVGGGLTIPYTYSSRRDAAPTAGQFSWYVISNWATSILAVPNYVDRNGFDWTGAVSALFGIQSNPPYVGQMRVWKAADPTVFVQFSFNDFEDNVGSYVMARQNGTDAESGIDPFTDGDLVFMSITMSGKFGTDGTDGGISFKSSLVAGNTNTDPGAGNFGVNNGTMSAVTELYISDTDGNGNNITALLASFASSTSPSTGYLRFAQSSSKAQELVTYSIFKITGYTAQSGYAQFEVTWVADGQNAATFGANQVYFTATGDKGAAGPTLVMQQSSTGPVGSAPTVIQTGTTFAVEDEFEIITNDQIEIAAGACLAVH